MVLTTFSSNKHIQCSPQHGHDMHYQPTLHGSSTSTWTEDTCVICLTNGAHLKWYLQEAPSIVAYNHRVTACVRRWPRLPATTLMMINKMKRPRNCFCRWMHRLSRQECQGHVLHVLFVAAPVSDAAAAWSAPARRESEFLCVLLCPCLFSSFLV